MRRIMLAGFVLAAAALTACEPAATGPTGGPAAQATAAPAAPAPAPATSSPAPAGRAPASPAPSAGKPTTPAKPAKACPQGDKQREVETALAAIGGFGQVSVDGTQSAEDCAAIVAFQRRFGVSPANGRAGGTTADVARRIAVSHGAAALARCGAGAGTTACIDLTNQTVWVVRDSAVIWGPTVTRTGMRGYATPTGTYKINFRNLKEWSDPYEVWLPYWQHFTSGIGFHQTTTYLHNSRIGSHGCVNLLPTDAKSLWTTIGKGTTVKVFGRRPGT